jgi:hypothetical protein
MGYKWNIVESTIKILGYGYGLKPIIISHPGRMNIHLPAILIYFGVRYQGFDS